MKRTTIIRGTGNVFTDLGFSPADAKKPRIRSELVTAVRTFIEKEGMSQADAAKRLNVSQPRISDLTRGKISRFSLDALVNMVTDAGMDVAAKITQPTRRLA